VNKLGFRHPTKKEIKKNERNNLDGRIACGEPKGGSFRILEKHDTPGLFYVLPNLCVFFLYVRRLCLVMLF